MIALTAITMERKVTSRMRKASPSTKAKTNGVRKMMLSRKSMLRGRVAGHVGLDCATAERRRNDVLAQVVHGVDGLLLAECRR